MSDQLDLFGAAAASVDVGLAPAAARLADLGRALPEGLFFGTSSWSFSGWTGIVFERAASQTVLARRGLAAYARHPLMKSVGVDRSHYAPVGVEVWRDYAAQVPDSFRFVAKAHEACTLARFPEHARYGKERGRENRLFLDAAYASDLVVAPYLEGAGAKAGPLLFQFAPQDPQLFGGKERFAERLHRFLERLPRGACYAVEVRNPELLTSEYAQALAATGAVHCYNVWGAMPLVSLQAERAPLGGIVVVRWLLPRGLDYEEARLRYQPFDRLVDEHQDLRDDIAGLVIAALASGRPVFVIVNNKAEGSAPLSILKLAERVLALWRK